MISTLFRGFRRNAGQSASALAVGLALLPWVFVLLADTIDIAGLLIVWCVFAGLVVVTLISFFVIKDTAFWGRAGGYEALRSTPINTPQLLAAEVFHALWIVMPVIISTLSLHLYFSAISGISLIPGITTTVLMIYLISGILVLLSAHLSVRLLFFIKPSQAFTIIILLGLSFFLFPSAPPSFWSATLTLISLSLVGILGIALLCYANLAVTEKI